MRPKFCDMNAQPHLVSIRSRSPSSRILLRSPIHSDAYSLLARVHDPECTTYLPHLRNPRNPITLASNQKNIKAWRAESGLTGLFLVIVLLPSASDTLSGIVDPEGPGATIGDTGFGPLDLKTKTAELGIMLNSGPAIRGRGFAVEALELCFAYGFEKLDLEVIELGTDKDNIPMRSLLEKKLGLTAAWREEKDDWCFSATKLWWADRQAWKGSAKLELEVEETVLDEAEVETVDAA